MNCKPVYIAHKQARPRRSELKEQKKCMYNTRRTCSWNSIEIAQEQYENTALGKPKKKKKTPKQMIKTNLYRSQRRKWKLGAFSRVLK